MAYFTETSPLLIKLTSAFVIILLGIVFGRFFGKLIQRILNELEVERFLKREGMKIPLEDLIGNLVKYIIYILTLLFALSRVGLTETVLNSILIILLILLIFFIIFAFKDFVPNLSAGLYIHQKDFIKKGDTITLNNTSGIVQSVSLTEVKIMTSKGDIIFIPNSLFMKNKLMRRK